MERIEADLERVGLDVVVTPREPRLHAPRLAVPQTGADHERVVLEQDPHLGALGDRLPLARIELGEDRFGGCGRPRRLVEHAVDVQAAGGARGTNDRGRVGRAAVGGRSVRRVRGREPGERESEDESERGRAAGEHGHEGPHERRVDRTGRRRRR